MSYLEATFGFKLVACWFQLNFLLVSARKQCDFCRRFTHVNGFAMVTHEQLQHIRFGDQFVVNILDGGQNTPLHGFVICIVWPCPCESAEEK